MKTLTVVIRAELEVPDDWELVEHPSGMEVLKVGDAFVDFDIAPLTTKSAAPEAEWSDTDVDMVGTVLDTIVGMDVEFEAQTIHWGRKRKVSIGTIPSDDAPMKIHQLPNGARFEYEGEEYVKTGPLFATGKGGQRLIPKYAVLKPLGAAEGAGEKSKNDAFSRPKVLKAFETFYAECQRRLPEDQQLALAAAREQFLQALD